MPRILDIDLDDFCRRHAEGAHDGELARYFDCSRHTILNYRRRLGLPSNALRIDGRVRETNRLWARLSLDEKVALLLQSAKSQQSAEGFNDA